jgi:hypothetical protein
MASRGRFASSAPHEEAFTDGNAQERWQGGAPAAHAPPHAAVTEALALHTKAERPAAVLQATAAQSDASNAAPAAGSSSQLLARLTALSPASSGASAAGSVPESSLSDKSSAVSAPRRASVGGSAPAT